MTWPRQSRLWTPRSSPHRRDSRHLNQPCPSPVELRHTFGMNGEVPELPSGPRCLAVNVQMSTFNSEHPRRVRHAADEIEHPAFADRSRRTECPTDDGPQMVFELARLGA